MAANLTTNQTTAFGDPSYPGASTYDKVEVTPAGHTFRVNDEPGDEEISRKHATGTSETWDNGGGRTVKVVGENYTAYHNGNKLLVSGACNITVSGGNCNLIVNEETTEDGEKTGGNFSVTAQTISLNSITSTTISAGTGIILDTRGAEGGGGSEGQGGGGDISLLSAGGYKLKCTDATETIDGKIETRVLGEKDLRIGTGYDVVVTNGNYTTNVNGGQTDFITSQKMKLNCGEGEVEIGAKRGIQVQSTDETISLTSKQQTEITSEDASIDLESKTKTTVAAETNIEFNSTQSTIFDSQNLAINSGPVTVAETIDADGDITGGSNSISLNNHTHTDTTGLGAGTTTPPN
jgi:hypothetical protein